MKRSIMSWQVLILTVMASVLLSAQVSRSDDDDDDRKGKGKGKGKKGPDVVEVDLSKLPSDLARELRAQLQKKSKGRAISLIEAIKIVENKGRGEVERASRKISKTGEITFSVEVNTGERDRTRYTLDARGKITDTRKDD